MKKLIIATIALTLAAPALRAQDSEQPKLKISPTGRILLDGALFASPDKEMFKDGATVSDVRLGAKASFGKWAAKIDVGFAGGKVGLKDIYLQYNFDNENYLRGGSFIHQYGLQSGTSSSYKPTYAEPLSNTVFNAARQVGFMYAHTGKTFLATVSAHVEPQAVILTPNQMGQTGYGFLTRLAYHPLAESGRIAQIGISGGFTTPQTSGKTGADGIGIDHNVISFAGNFPTSVDKVTAISGTVGNAMNMWKFTPDFLVSFGKVALEGQYFFNRVNRRDGLPAFTGQGAYAIARILCIGQAYDYSFGDGYLATPRPKTLEFVAGYNYTTLSDPKAGIRGGRVNQMSATLNYQINKYMVARLNYTYTHRWAAADLIRTDLNVFQARLQIIF